MKIRTGFVSNSSSSSFVVFYTDASIEEIDENDIAIFGDYLDEGRDYFKPDQETKEFFKMFWDGLDAQGTFSIVHEVVALSEWDEKTSVNIPAGTKCSVFEADQHDSGSFEAFEDNYVGYHSISFIEDAIKKWDEKE